MKIQTFDPKLNAESAITRTDRITTGTFLWAKLTTLLGSNEEPEDTLLIYYPDYIAYTTVELHRYFRDDRTVKFLVGIDAITSRVGEVDVELPPRKPVYPSSDVIISTELTPTDAEREWEEWIFTYINRRFRPFKRPDTSLDQLELIYVPYWLIDYGTLTDSYVISGLTKQVEEVVSIKPIKGYYERIRGINTN